MSDGRHKVLNGLKAMSNLQRITKQESPVIPEITPRLTASPFTIDHRSETIQELRADADILDKEAAEKTAMALSLRLAADHLEAHPPEP